MAQRFVNIDRETPMLLPPDIRDPAGQFEPQALLSTDQTLAAPQIVEFFVRRWPMEVTFEEANEHLGLPGQRQWHDLAIERSTPVRLGLFSLVALLAPQQHEKGHPIPGGAFL